MSDENSLNSNPITLYVVRHGESFGNIESVLGADFDLTENGKAQAQALKDQFKNVSFDLIVSSDLIRAHRTAQIIAAERNLAHITSELLRERHYGQHDGTPFTQLTQELQQALFEYQVLTSKDRTHLRPIPEMENDEELTGRILTFIRELAIAHAHKTILLVAHGDIMASLLVHLGFADRPQLSWGAIENTGYFVLETDGLEFKIVKTQGINKMSMEKSRQMKAMNENQLLSKQKT